MAGRPAEAAEAAGTLRHEALPAPSSEPPPRTQERPRTAQTHPREAARPALRVQLTGRGLLLLTAAAALVVTGAVAAQPVVVAWGSVPLAVLLAAWAWARLAVDLRPGARPLALTCGAPVGPRKIHAVGDELSLPMTLTSRLGGPPPVAVELHLVTSGALEPVDGAPLTAILAPNGNGSLAGAAALRPIQAGTWFVHGADVVVPVGGAALVAVVGYLPIEARFKVLPRSAWRSSRATLPMRRSASRASARDSLGAARSLVRGTGTDLRELRDHLPGDPFKHIAWRASARAGKLVVKEFESAVTQSCLLLLDTGPSMRWGARGQTPLDRATDVAFAWAQELARGGIRFGLACFDTAVWAATHVGDGRRALVSAADLLLEAHTSVREPVTAVTDAELVAAVGRYLHRQWGRDFRARRDEPLAAARPPITAWWDADAMSAWVSTLLPQLTHDLPGHHADVRLADDPRMADLRLLCRVQGIELPARAGWSDRAREAGLVAALQKALASPGGPHSLLVLTDLLGVDDPQPVARVVAALVRRKFEVTFVLPRPAQEPEGERLADRAARAEHARLVLERDRLVAQLRAAGARVS